MARFDLPLFPIMLVLSLAMHASAFFYLDVVVTPPELIPSQPGVASIKLVSSEATRPQPTPEDRPAKDPKLTEPIEPQPRPTPVLKTPSLAEIGHFLAELMPPPPKETPKPPEPIKPIAEPPPMKKNELPPKEKTPKVAPVVSSPSPSSQEMQGAVEELPQKLAVNPPPPYPADAIAARQEGTVTLRVNISAEGRVTAAAVYSSSGVPSLDESALTTVRRWIFSPARRGNRAVPFEVLVPVEFSIRRAN